MSFTLLAPIGLAALAAAALPIAIHLVRRLQPATTEFAALRWISERVGPRRRILFERPWLLLLRLVLIALLALLLAQPVLFETARAPKPWIVVAPGVDRASALAAGAGIDADWRWLLPGFPSFDSVPPSTNVPLASLLRELDAQQPASAKITVVVPQEVGGLDGERPQIAHAFDWRFVAGRMADTVPTAPAAPIHFAVRYSAETRSSLMYLRAAVAAWNQREPGRYLLDAQPLDAPIPAETQWLAWLAPQTTPAVSAWIEHGGVALLTNRPSANGVALWRNGRQQVLARIESSGRGSVLALPGTLTPSALPLLLDAGFPDRLRVALRGAAPAPTRAHADAVKPRHIDRVIGDARASEGSNPLDTRIALLVAALFVVERIVATRVRKLASS